MYEPGFPDPVLTGVAHPARNFQMFSYPGESGPVWKPVAGKKSFIEWGASEV